MTATTSRAACDLRGYLRGIRAELEAEGYAVVLKFSDSKEVHSGIVLFAGLLHELGRTLGEILHDRLKALDWERLWADVGPFLEPGAGTGDLWSAGKMERIQVVPARPSLSCHIQIQAGEILVQVDSLTAHDYRRP